MKCNSSEVFLVLTILQIEVEWMTFDKEHQGDTTMKTILTLLLTIVLASQMSYADTENEILYPRHPALSPDGSTIAFCYMGDIWLVPSQGGVATRLTFHEADDIRPQFSPDGGTILFSSRRFNNYDVFTIPATGGEARQLTVHSASDIGTGWFPDGDSVLFSSKRDGWRDVFKVSIDGGTPIRLTGYRYEQEYCARMTPDRKHLLYNTGSGMSRWWRRDLKSSRNADIFLLDRSKDEFTSIRLTDYENHDVWPILNTVTDEMYFVSCRSEYGQIFKIPMTGGQPVRITDFNDDGVQWLNSNPQGTLLVFERDLGIWLLDPDRGPAERVHIKIKSDERENLIEMKSFDNKVEWFSVSPDEKKIATIVHGEIFIIPAGDPKIGRRITHTAARERFVVWGEDSKTIYYASDRNGNYDIFSADVTTGVEKLISGAIEDETKPIVSPDGKYLAFYRGLDKIIRYDIEKDSDTVWVDGRFIDLGVEPTIEYHWSPDSRWLAFTAAGPTYESDIYICDLDGNTHNISKFSGYNFRPRFSDDGDNVCFTSSVADRLETYKIDLVRQPVEFIESSLDSLFLSLDDEEDEDKGESDEESDSVIIDFNGIDQRRSKAYNLSAASYNPVLTSDGERYVFVSSLLGKPEIWTVNSDGEPKLKQLTHSGGSKSYLTVSSDSDTIFFLENGTIRKISVDGGEMTTLSFKADMEIDLIANNRQKFDESWSMLNTYFYDSTFHGTDWLEAKLKYEPAMSHVRTIRDFSDIMMEMMGELRASHLAVYLNPPSPDKQIETAYIGVVFDYGEIDRTGHFRIEHVIPESPADIAGIQTGEYIISMADEKLTRDANFNKLLAGTKDKRLAIVVADKPGGTEKKLYVKPISAGAQADLVYADWVEARRNAVDSLSGGRLAYLHIRAMSRSKLDVFRQELVSIAEYKDGLIIDVRNNFGGNIAVHLLGILVKTPYVLRDFRGFPATSENKMRSKAYEKPMALLINNYSASNSEIFAEGFRKLGLGKIIGEPTAGAVIGTSSYQLIDGTGIRRPSWGAYSAEMEDTEIHPRKPDIFVENLPDDFMNGRDPQLVRAVDELLKELGD